MSLVPVNVACREVRGGRGSWCRRASNAVTKVCVTALFSGVLVSCQLFVTELRAFGIADEFVANYEASRLAMQAIAADYLPEDDEYYAGRLASANILERYEILDDQEAARYVNVLGQTIALASRRPVIYAGYRFAILDTDEINALATPAGHVFVTRGLLELTETEGEVAAILAHEIAHIALRHGADAIMNTRGRGLALRAEALTLQLEAVGLSDTSLGRGAQVVRDRSQTVIATLFGNGYSREAEIEADVTAVEMLLQLGYDPYSLVRVLERLEEVERESGGSVGGLFDTHPHPRRRIWEIERRLANYTGVVSINTAVTQQRYERALGSL